MDPITIATTALTVFTTCYKVYQVLSEAIEVDAEARVWGVRMRLERVRFEVWGRTLGFLDEITGQLRDAKDLQSLNMGGLGAVMQIDEARKIVGDLLASVALALEDCCKTAEEYSLNVKEKEPLEGSGEEGNKENKSRRKLLEGGVRKMWRSTTKLGKHVGYVVADGDLMDTHITKLCALNNSLEQLLTLPQKVQFARAVTGEVLAHYQSSEELEDVRLATAAVAAAQNKIVGGQQPGSVLESTARIKQLCALPMGMDKSEHGIYRRNGIVQRPGRHQLPSGRVSVWDKPWKLDVEPLWRISRGEFSPKEGQQAVSVIFEWRASTSTLAFMDSVENLKMRGDLVVDFLRESSALSEQGDYRILYSHGYVESVMPDRGSNKKLIGFVSQTPDWADGTKSPKTLYKLLLEAFQSDDPTTTPSLRTRFNLAKQLAGAVYQLQCSNWLHRGLNSHHIIFFYDRAKGSLRLDQPFLGGLQYSRPDDVRHLEGEVEVRSEGMGVHHHRASWGGLELYLHPNFLKRPRRYRRSDDVYSLGVVLLEIAFWEPVEAFYHNGHGPGQGSGTADAVNPREVVARVLRTARTELAAEVGELYRDAVVLCLEGVRASSQASTQEAQQPGHNNVEGNGVEDRNSEAGGKGKTMGDSEGEYDGRYRGEDPEYGLEVDFNWKILQQLEKCAA